MNFKGFGPLIAVACVGVGLAILAEPIANWISKNRAEYNGAVIGRIVHAEGNVRRLHKGNIDIMPSPIKQPIELRDGDRLETSVLSRATVVLNSEDEFEIPAGADIHFELWNPKDTNSPIYIQLLLGEPTLKRAGIRGRAYVVKDGRLYLPGQAVAHKPMALTVLKNAPLDMQLAADEPPLSEDTGATDSDAAAEAPAANTADPDTLSNEYIDDTITGHQGLLQKCWLSRLKYEPNAKGQITVQFEITNRGRVKDPRVGDSTMKDEELKKCVLSVFERMTFRSYKGAEISLSYPINFE